MMAIRKQYTIGSMMVLVVAVAVALTYREFIILLSSFFMLFLFLPMLLFLPVICAVAQALNDRHSVPKGSQLQEMIPEGGKISDGNSIR